MYKLKNNLLLIALSFVIAACNEQSEAPVARNWSFWNYTLEECVVKVNFNWDTSIIPANKYETLQKTSEQIMLAMESGEYPLFGSGYTRVMNYYMFYFADECEKRVEYTESIISQYIRKKVVNFPSHELQTEGIKFDDGVRPTGWWKNDPKFKK